MCVHTQYTQVHFVSRRVRLQNCLKIVSKLSQNCLKIVSTNPNPTTAIMIFNCTGSRRPTSVSFISVDVPINFLFDMVTVLVVIDC